MAAVFDPNIFFRGAQLRNQQQQQGINAISQGLAAIARQRELDETKLKRQRQEALDPTNILQTAIMGGQLTPEQEAAFQAQQLQLGQQRAVDPVTGQTFQKVTPIDLAQVRGGRPRMAEFVGGLADPAQMQRNQAMVGTGDPYAVDPAMGEGIPMSEAQVMEMMGDLPPVAGSPMVDPIQVPQMEGMTPRTRQAAQEAAVEGDVQMQLEQRKAEFEKKKERPRAERAFGEMSGKVESLTQDIDRAIEQVQPYTAGVGSYLSLIRGTPAADLRASLDTIKADAAFGALQAMRDASKTGGALGAISERELSLLQNAQAALGEEQSPEQLRRNLMRYKEIRQNALRNVAEAYRDDYGMYPEGFNGMTPSVENDPLGLFQ